MTNAFSRLYGDDTNQREPALAEPRPVVPHAIMETPPNPIALSQLAKVIERLESVIDHETEVLRSRGAIDLKEWNNRKNQGLLDLTRALRPLGLRGPDAKTLAALARLRAKLEVNRALIRNHVEAVREISAMLCEAIRNLESDGTYAPAVRRAGPRS
jgi:hypothetical protein